VAEQLSPPSGLLGSSRAALLRAREVRGLRRCDRGGWSTRVHVMRSDFCGNAGRPTTAIVWIALGMITLLGGVFGAVADAAVFTQAIS